MSTTSNELRLLQEQIKTTIEPLKEKERELRKILEQEREKDNHAKFEKIANKLFYTETNPFKGKGVSLIKPFNLQAAADYHSYCEVMEIHIAEFDNGVREIKFSYDTTRLDMLLQMKEASTELREKVKSIAEANLQQSLNKLFQE
jgi:hypothetical protein